MIVDEGDAQALEEFHTHRRVFGKLGSQTQRFGDYVNQLVSQSEAHHCAHALEFARDLLVDRFSSLSEDGVNCRRYFAGVLDIHAPDEATLCYRLTGLIWRHFRFGLKEAYRNGTRTRYVWEVNNQRLEVLFPRELSGHQRRKWLESCASDVDLTASDAREQVQMRIDEELGHSMQDSLDGADGLQSRLAAPYAPSEHLDRIGVHGLAHALADEKVDQIDHQRRAIRCLGSARLHDLVCTIFEAIDTERYEEKSIASAFGLSAATFSRFAGSRWHSGNKPIPDLWRNLAQLLAFDVRFAALCADSGIVPFLNSHLDREDSHD